MSLAFNPGKAPQRAAEETQVAGARPAGRHAGQQPLHVVDLPQGFVQMIGQGRIGHELGDGLLPGLDRRHVDQRVGQPVGQEPRAHGGDGAVQHGQQRAVAAALADGPRDLQAAAAGFVDLQGRGAAIGLQAIDVLQRGLLRLVEIIDHARPRPAGPGRRPDRCRSRSLPGYSCESA